MCTAVYAASYTGTLNVQEGLYSGSVALYAEASLSCGSFNSPNSTVTSVTTNTMTIDTLITDKLIAKNGVLRLSNNVQVTGKVIYGQTSTTSFLEKDEVSYTSFLGPSRSFLEEEMNSRHSNQFSFIQLPGAWTSLGTHSLVLDKLHLKGLAPHTAIRLTANVFIEASGSAFLKVDDKVVWMESCEWCFEEWSSPISVTLAHVISTATIEMKATAPYRVTEVEVAIRG